MIDRENTMNELGKQITKFGIVGVICFGIDYSLMILLTELGKVDYLISSGISFSVSVVINYLLSMCFVFARKKNRNRVAEFFMFLILSVSGLGLTELLMWLIVERAGIHYTISKILVTGLVMVYNFVTRKIFLEDRHS